MAITRQDVEYVAGLARLRLSDDEKEKFSSQLESIVGYVEKLNELDTEGEVPTAHVLPLKNVTRKDEARSSIAREEVLRLAPKEGEGFYRVPKVIE